MKKLVYTGAFAALTFGFVACSEAEEESTDGTEEMEIAEEEVSEETAKELHKTIELQEEAEQLDNELSEYIETL
ncbi:MAG: hypothetical protein HWE22_07535 [Flavobacteriales bacterium]|nr:hypothetical protein [Flavobacteriales bacterium]